MSSPTQELLNDIRFKLHARRGVLQAHLEMIEIAIQQHNRYFEDTANLVEHEFRVAEEQAFDRYLCEIDGI